MIKNTGANVTNDSTDWKKLHGDHFRNYRVLVTGGAGFIGSHLTSALAELGATVIVLDDLSGGNRQNIAFLPSSQFIESSILDAKCLSDCAKDCRYLFHLAALGSVPKSVEQPRLYQQVNAKGTLNVLETARQLKISRVMFAASSSAYGDNDVPWI